MGARQKFNSVRLNPVNFSCNHFTSFRFFFDLPFSLRHVGPANKIYNNTCQHQPTPQQGYNYTVSKNCSGARHMYMPSPVNFILLWGYSRAYFSLCPVPCTVFLLTILFMTTWHIKIYRIFIVTLPCRCCKSYYYWNRPPSYHHYDCCVHHET